jgi:hypothetical protein
MPLAGIARRGEKGRMQGRGIPARSPSPDRIGLAPTGEGSIRRGTHREGAGDRFFPEPGWVRTPRLPMGAGEASVFFGRRYSLPRLVLRNRPPSCLHGPGPQWGVPGSGSIPASDIPPHDGPPAPDDGLHRHLHRPVPAHHGPGLFPGRAHGGAGRVRLLLPQAPLRRRVRGLRRPRRPPGHPGEPPLQRPGPGLPAGVGTGRGLRGLPGGLPLPGRCVRGPGGGPGLPHATGGDGGGGHHRGTDRGDPPPQPPQLPDPGGHQGEPHPPGGGRCQAGGLRAPTGPGGRRIPRQPRRRRRGLRRHEQRPGGPRLRHSGLGHHGPLLRAELRQRAGGVPGLRPGATRGLRAPGGYLRDPLQRRPQRHHRRAGNGRPGREAQGRATGQRRPGLVGPGDPADAGRSRDSPTSGSPHRTSWTSM